MKNFLRILLTFAVLVALVFGLALSVQAQETTNRYTLTPAFQYASTTSVSTNIATGVVATNTTQITGAIQANNLAIQLTLNALGAGATNICTVTVQKSVDGSNWLTDGTLLLTGTAATAASCISNWTAQAAPYWRLFTIASTAAGTGTNLSVTVSAHGKAGL